MYGLLILPFVESLSILSTFVSSRWVRQLFCSLSLDPINYVKSVRTAVPGNGGLRLHWCEVFVNLGGCAKLGGKERCLVLLAMWHFIS